MALRFGSVPEMELRIKSTLSPAKVPSHKLVPCHSLLQIVPPLAVIAASRHSADM